MKTVEINSEVLIEFEDGFKATYKLVKASEADYSTNKVSIDTPFGNAVLDQPENITVTYLNPYGQEIYCKILKIL